MFLNIQEKKHEFVNEPEQIQIMINEINDYLQQNILKLSYLIVDGIPVYNDFEAYLFEHLSELKEIELVVFNSRQIINNTLIMTNDYIHKANPLVTDLAEAFYRQPDEQAWISLNDLLEGLQWIIESLSKIDRFDDLGLMINNHKTWNEYVQNVSELNLLIPQLEQVLVDKDFVSVGDLLMYEIIPMFEQMSEKLVFLLPQQEENFVS